MERNKLGVAIVGAGRVGSLRASLAANNPAVHYLALSDVDPTRAKALADKVGADLASADNHEVISRPEVNAVFVATPEHDHAEAVLDALEQKKPVLVEKPIALTLKDADRMLAAAARTGTELRVGYSMRFKRQYLLAKEQIVHNRLGRILGGTARTYNSRAQTLQILQRSAHANPVMDVITHPVDMMCWFLDGNPPAEVVARGQSGVFREKGYDADDVTWAIITFADGAVITFGVDSAFPEKYPTLGQSPRYEILGKEGVMLFDEDHKEQVLYTNAGIPHYYVPGHTVNMAFLSSSSSGDWALGDYWGPVADETRIWLDHLAIGRPCVVATGQDGRRALEVTLAIERASKTRETVRLPLAD